MTETKTRRFQICSREMLKTIAMVFMVLDHAYMTVVNAPGFEWVTQLGRLAFPIFAFGIAEGYTHTSNRKKYVTNIAVFALISEIPYNLMMGGEILGPFHQSVMCTFLLAILFLTLIDRVLCGHRSMIGKVALILMLCVCGVLAGTLTFVDYSGFGVLTVILFYLAKKLPNRYMEMAMEFAGLWLINWVFLGGKVLIFSNGFEFPEQGLALFSLVFIWTYNGKKMLTGKAATIFKYVCYGFYPVHILILSLIALYLL